MRVAVVHDWLVKYAGSERVLGEILNCFPQAALFSIVDALPPSARHFLADHVVSTSFLQAFPFSGKLYQKYLPLLPAAVESFDLREYDLIISSSSGFAKGVLTTPDQLHVSYMQSRGLRYAYDERFEYQSGAISSLVQNILFSKIRVWDSIAAQRPDFTLANSQFVKDWHFHRHKIESEVIYPPVDVSLFSSHFQREKDGYFVVVSRFEPYKRVDLVVQAFSAMELPLVVIGSGSREKVLRKMAGPNVEFVGEQGAAKVAEIVSRAKALVFAGCEDFGIALVEAQACGTPVIAYGRGGAAETIQGLESAAPTGVLFAEQTAAAIVAAVMQFERARAVFNPEELSKHAGRFAPQFFREKFSKFIDERWDEFRCRGRSSEQKASDTKRSRSM